jgi:hypothetical protein
MPKRKEYIPHCPANCAGGHIGRLYEVTPEFAKITQEVLSRRGDTNQIYRCGYCGLVWFQKSSRKLGFEPIPAGFFDNFTNPNEFVAVAVDFPIRPQNTREYWDNYREKAQKRRGQRGRRRR